MYRQKEKGVTRLTGQGITEILNAVYPVGAYFFTEVATNPGVVFGFGTWTQVSKGRMLIGQDPADPDFDVAGEFGGEKTHVLTAAESPGHTHSSGTLATGTTGSSHTHSIQRGTGTGSAPARVAAGSTTDGGDINTGTTGSGHTHNVTGDTGGVIGTNGQAHNNMPPYLVAYIWKRTA